MRLDYTEFSFGYAFTENLIRSTATRPMGAPIFPNLIQEAQLGYDVHIDIPGYPLFFQYKLPELMVRNTAAEISYFALAGIKVPFFRMHLMRRDLSSQHERLVQLEGRFLNSVYYATPGLENLGAFNTAYNAAKVHIHSVLFSPADIGLLPDDKPHAVAYRPGLRHAWLCSEPREIPALRFEAADQVARQNLETQRYPTLGATLQAIRQEMLPLAPKEIRDAEGAIRQRIRVRRASFRDRPELDGRTIEAVETLLTYREIARVGLGLDMAIAQPREEPE